MNALKKLSSIDGGVRWDLDPRRFALEISGRGPMADYDPFKSGLPAWCHHRPHIKRILINDGITHIGAYAFFPYDFGSLSEHPSSIEAVMFPGSLESIGRCAFRGNINMDRVDLSGCKDLRVVEDYAFASCHRLRHVSFHGCARLEKLEIHTFLRCDSLQYLSLSGCRLLPGETVAAIREALPADCLMITPGGDFLFQPITAIRRSP